MATDEPVATAESVTYKRFCSPTAIHGQSQLEISGFGVRVPGGAQKPRSQRRPGFLHARSAPLTHHFPGSQRQTDPSALAPPLPSEGPDGLFGLHLIVTVRHITSVRSVADFSDSPRRQALSRQPSHRLEA
jgi:hypothetical protein